MNDEIRLTIPAKPEMMIVARMALAGFCSQGGADVDTLDDIRILSDEACYCLMNQPRPADALTVSATAEGRQARIRFEARHGNVPAEARGGHDPEIARGILGTLASDVILSHDNGNMHAIEVVVHLSPF